MSIAHHPSDSLLVAYAAGVLPEAQALVVATHGTLCAACRARIGAFEVVGGDALAHAEPLALAADAARRALDRVRTLSSWSPETGPASDLPSPLAGYLPGGLSAVHWRAVAPKVAVSRIAMQGGGRFGALMLRVRPGVALPSHGHEGSELTLVLRGSFTDASGRYARGDVAEVDEPTSHVPTAGPEDDCICVIAIEGKLRFDNLGPRLAQPLVGI